jgi:hypothetical protein
MEKAKKVKCFPSFEEYTRLTFEKCIRSITGVERTDRAMEWMKRFLKAVGASKATWFHKKEVPDYFYAAGTSRAFAKWKREEIARSASKRGKRRGPRLNRKDKPVIAAVIDEVQNHSSNPCGLISLV